MRSYLSFLGMFLFTIGAFAANDTKEVRSVRCFDTNTNGTWKIEVKSQKNGIENWAKVSYELKDVDCNNDDVHSWCNETGGIYQVSTSYSFFESCAIQGTSVSCPKKSANDLSFVNLADGKLQFFIDSNTDLSSHLMDLLGKQGRKDKSGAVTVKDLQCGSAQ